MKLWLRLFGVICDDCGKLVKRRKAEIYECYYAGGCHWVERYCKKCDKKRFPR